MVADNSERVLHTSYGVVDACRVVGPDKKLLKPCEFNQVKAYRFCFFICELLRCWLWCDIMHNRLSLWCYIGNGLRFRGCGCFDNRLRRLRGCYCNRLNNWTDEVRIDRRYRIRAREVPYRKCGGEYKGCGDYSGTETSRVVVLDELFVTKDGIVYFHSVCRGVVIVAPISPYHYFACLQKCDVAFGVTIG